MLGHFDMADTTGSPVCILNFFAGINSWQGEIVK